MITFIECPELLQKNMGAIKQKQNPGTQYNTSGPIERGIPLHLAHKKFDKVNNLEKELERISKGIKNDVVIIE